MSKQIVVGELRGNRFPDRMTPNYHYYELNLAFLSIKSN
jgi:hypothetical protein